MSKIAIISQPDQGVLIDVSGCTTLQEATHHLTSTLQISSEFWKGISIDLNLGKLRLTAEEVAQIMSIASEVGLKPNQVFAEDEQTAGALQGHNIRIGRGQPMSLPDTSSIPEVDEEGKVLSEAPSPGAAAEIDVRSPGYAPAPTATTSSCAESADEPQCDGLQAAVLYLKQGLRSGQAVSHQGHLVIIGDVNPGAEVMAAGDITVWGALRGIAHAGVGGNIAAEIRALRLEPIQLRIAHAIARCPDRPGKRRASSSSPETARIVNGTIRIAANNPE